MSKIFGERDSESKPLLGVYGMPPEELARLKRKGGLCFRAFYNFGLQIASPINSGQVGFGVNSGAAECCGPDGLCQLWDKVKHCCLEHTKLEAEVRVAELQAGALVRQRDRELAGLVEPPKPPEGG